MRQSNQDKSVRIILDREAVYKKLSALSELVEKATQEAKDLEQPPLDYYLQAGAENLKAITEQVDRLFARIEESPPDRSLAYDIEATYNVHFDKADAAGKAKTLLEAIERVKALGPDSPKAEPYIKCMFDKALYFAQATSEFKISLNP